MNTLSLTPKKPHIMSQNSFCASVISLSLLVTVKGKKATLDKTSLQSFSFEISDGLHNTLEN